MSDPSPPAPRRLYIRTYGCQMNVYDATRMADVLAPEGYDETSDIAEADLVILNTCHIRERASEKVFSELGKVREIKMERAAAGRETTIAVAGCVAQAEGKEILQLNRATRYIPTAAENYKGLEAAGRSAGLI